MLAGLDRTCVWLFSVLSIAQSTCEPVVGTVSATTQKRLRPVC